MSVSATPRPLTAARKGQIVQRVLVDGWSSAQAAAAFGVKARSVDAWVADYRHRGMASLRGPVCRRFAARILLPVRAGLRRLFGRTNMAEAPILPGLRNTQRSRR